LFTGGQLMINNPSDGVVPAGTEALPGITAQGNPDTGIYFPSDQPDEIAISAVGVEVFRIDSTGKVGIGTNNPTSKLHVAGVIAGTNGSESAPSFTRSADTDTGMFFPSTNILGFTTAGTERARIDASGKVLIGNTTARSNLQSSVTPPVQVEGTTLSNASLSAVRNSADTAAPALILGKTRGTSVGATTIVNSGDHLGWVSFTGSDGTNFIEAAYIQVSVDGTPGTNDMPGRLMFFTTPDGSSVAVERVRINNAGNVGIGGLINSSAILEVNSTTKAFMPPRMTTTQKNAIASPAAGMLVFDTTLAKLSVYSGSAWQTVTSV
jgi:hypothetical protein